MIFHFLLQYTNIFPKDFHFRPFWIAHKTWILKNSLCLNLLFSSSIFEIFFQKILIGKGLNFTSRTTFTGHLRFFIFLKLNQWVLTKFLFIFQRSLTLDCKEGQPGIIQWTPDRDTPDLVYYQCYTHRYLGWKIHVVDSCDQWKIKNINRKKENIHNNFLVNPGAVQRFWIDGFQIFLKPFYVLSHLL